MKAEIKKQKRHRRHKKIRTRIKGTAQRPRFCVFRSLQHIYAQLIDDEKNNVLISVSDLDIKNPSTGKKKSSSGEAGAKRGSKENSAFEIGKLIAEKSKELKVTEVVFDRGGFIFHGRIKAVADGAREGGLKF